jgi:hypothetical protein
MRCVTGADPGGSIALAVWCDMPGLSWVLSIAPVLVSVDLLHREWHRRHRRHRSIYKINSANRRCVFNTSWPLPLTAAGLGACACCRSLANVRPVCLCLRRACPLCVLVAAAAASRFVYLILYIYNAHAVFGIARLSPPPPRSRPHPVRHAL